MKLRYLGTAAAEGIPAMFCDCTVCRRSRESGGANLRSRSQAILDERILFDFPPDTYLHVLYHKLDLTKVHHCLITHCHSDHLHPADLQMRKPHYAHLPQKERETPLTVYASAASGKPVLQAIQENGIDEDTLVLHQITPFVPFAVERYRVTYYHANHDPRIEPCFFSVDDGEKALLYAHDTGYFPEETWAYLEQTKPFFHFVSLDCTEPMLNCRNNHMSIVTCKEVRVRLLAIGCADESTRFCLHHFSHNGLATHDDLLEAAPCEGFLSSYDGMEVEI